MAEDEDDGAGLLIIGVVALGAGAIIVAAVAASSADANAVSFRNILLRC